MRNVIQKVLRRRRRGAVAMLAVATMLPLTGMMAASINSGQMVEDRRHVQDASDALSRMHGTWTARSMNILSMNSVSTTQLLTVALGSESLMGTLVEQQIAVAAALGHIASHAGRECQSRFPYDPWPAICAPWHAAVAVPAGIAEYRLIRIWTRYDPDHGIDVARKGLEAMEQMNRAIIERFPRAMNEIGSDYADVLGIDEFHFTEPCEGSLSKNCESGRTRDGMSLPIQQGGFQARLERCTFMMTGMTLKGTTFYTRGFPIGRGPMRYGGSSSEPELKPFINEETGVGEMLHDFKDFYDSNWSDLPRYWFSGFTDHPSWANLQGEQEEDGPNSFTRRYDAKYASICAMESQSIPNVWGFLPILEAPVPTSWELIDVPILGAPVFEPEDMPDAFKILALSSKDKSRRLGDSVFANRSDAHVGYGQSGVYNPDGASLYSQNWHQRMMEADRMDQPSTLANHLQNKAHNDFDELIDMLQQIGNAAGWERIHAH